MDAVTSSSPPAGAPTMAPLVWMRPDVHELPDPFAVICRSPAPSRWVLAVELVIVSISPVPKTPVPVSCTHCPDGALPAAPAKSSLKTVVKPAGGAGTADGVTAALAVLVPMVRAAVIAPAAVTVATTVTSHRRGEVFVLSRSMFAMTSYAGCLRWKRFQTWFSGCSDSVRAVKKSPVPELCQLSSVYEYRVRCAIRHVGGAARRRWPARKLTSGGGVVSASFSDSGWASEGRAEC